VSGLPDRSRCVTATHTCGCAICRGVSATLIWFTILDLQTAPSHTVMTVSVLAVGFFVGPVQPIAIEIAAECTYVQTDGPTDHLADRSCAIYI